MNGETEVEVARACLERGGFSRPEAEAALWALTLNGFLVIRTQTLIDRVITTSMEDRT